MKIGLLGIGTVASGVIEQIAERDDIEIKKILVRRDIPKLGSLSTYRFEEILNDPEIDTVVELIGGMEPAHTYVLQALRAGKHVVTANKLMLSYHFDELLQAAQQNHVALKIDASVGGSIPFLHNLIRSSCGDSIRSVFGIVNGTTNLILDTMQENGLDFSDVLIQAQHAGYAEADPGYDIDGLDARSKLCIAASIAFKKYIHPDEVCVAGIRNITGYDVETFRKMGYVCRLLVRAENTAEDKISAFVEPTLVSLSAVEATVHHSNNLIGLVGRHCGMQYYFGQGAGKSATAFAIMLGLSEIANPTHRNRLPSFEGHADIDNSIFAHRYYVRTTSRLSIPARKLRASGEFNQYITHPLPVDQMHALAASLSLRDPQLFFAGIRE